MRDLQESIFFMWLTWFQEIHERFHHIYSYIRRKITEFDWGKCTPTAVQWSTEQQLVYYRLNIYSKAIFTSDALGLQTPGTCSHSSQRRQRQGASESPLRFAGPDDFSPSLHTLKESSTSPGANPTLVNWDHLPLPAHSSRTFLFRNETVLRRPLGNETKMAFYFFFFFFFPIHHVSSRRWVPGHPGWHNPELAPSGSKWSHSFRVSRQKVHWEGHGRGLVLLSQGWGVAQETWMPVPEVGTKFWLLKKGNETWEKQANDKYSFSCLYW